MRQFPPLLLALVALSSACDRRVEPWAAPADEPEPLARPVRVPGLGNPPPRSRLQADTISGELRLAAGVSAPVTGVVFVIARSGATPGPPLAVKRLELGRFPLAYEIGPQDVMQGLPFRGPILLSARVDSDGDPLTRSPEDPVSAPLAPIEPGAAGVDLLLSPAGTPGSGG